MYICLLTQTTVNSMSSVHFYETINEYYYCIYIFGGGAQITTVYVGEGGGGMKKVGNHWLILSYGNTGYNNKHNKIF